MPPKKRKAAATAQRAAATTTPRSRRSAAPVEMKPSTTDSSRRSTKAAEPEVEVPVKKKPGRPPKATSAAPAAPSPAPGGRRGRPPKNDKANSAKDGAHEVTRQQSKPDENARPGKGRGRGAKKDADEPAAAPAPEPAPKKGRPGRKPAAAKTETEPVEEEPKDAPKKRSRRSTLIPESVEEMPKDAAEKRGRAQRATLDAQTEDKAARETEQPKRRGRPPIKNTTAKEELAPPARRGRVAAAPVEAPAIESAPKRRGRAAKAVEPELEVEQPKKRGRPAKAVEQQEAVEQPGKRGRAAKAVEQDAEVAQSKRRGRAATKTKDDEPAAAAPKKRGRPPAAKPAAPVAEQPQTRKRGRPKMAEEQRPKKSIKTAQPKATTKPAEAPKKRGRPAVSKAAATTQKSTKAKVAPKRKAEAAAPEEPQPKRRGPVKKPAESKAKSTATAKGKSTAAKANAKPTAEARSTAIERDPNTGIAYWLMKAEPESRLENGVDVKFSIDDLEAATEPEAWDGVRNHVAKNNMMSMKKGDLAFFYHSNCKTPGIAGIMEIAEEAAPDESAFDSKHPYYDSKSKRDKPTWHCVKVAFRSKFEHPERLTLTALKPLAADGGPLANMQLFKQSRLSVSKVSLGEWDFINSHVTGEAERLDAEEPVLVEKDVPEAPNGVADAVTGFERTEEDAEAEKDDAASENSEPTQPQLDDDELGLTIGTPKGAAALLEASKEPEADTTNFDATLVTAQEESSIVHENGVTTTTNITRETVIKGPVASVVKAAEIENEPPYEKDNADDQESSLSLKDEAQKFPSKQAEPFESSLPAGSVRSTSMQPRVEDAPEGNFEAPSAEKTQPAEEEPEQSSLPNTQGADAIAQNVSSSFGTSSGGVPNDENAPPSSYEAHNNHPAAANASANNDAPADDEMNASAMDFEMTGVVLNDAAQKQVLGELATSSNTEQPQPTQVQRSLGGLDFGFGGNSGF